METLPDLIFRHASGGGVDYDGGIPGFDSVSLVGVLAGFNPSDLDDDGLLQVMVESQRVVAAAQARQVKAMAELSRRCPRTFGHPFGEFVADEIAVELCLTRRAAENRLGQAVEMTTRTPAVLHALEAGALDLYRASAITDATYGLDHATATQVATDVVERVERRNA